MPTLPVVRSLLVGLVTVALAGCGGWGDVASTVDPSLPARTVQVGDETWIVLVAPADGQGMRGREDFAGADGMLFDLGRATDPSAVGFVMDGVTIPLDIAWFDERGDLIGTASMVPCATAPCPRYAPQRPFRWAIEAPPGAFDGMAPGTRLLVGA